MRVCHSCFLTRSNFELLNVIYNHIKVEVRSSAVFLLQTLNTSRLHWVLLKSYSLHLASWLGKKSVCLLGMWGHLHHSGQQLQPNYFNLSVLLCRHEESFWTCSFALLISQSVSDGHYTVKKECIWQLIKEIKLVIDKMRGEKVDDYIKVKGVTYWGPIVFPEYFLVDIIKKLLFNLKNNLNQWKERNCTLINSNTNVNFTQ